MTQEEVLGHKQLQTGTCLEIPWHFSSSRCLERLQQQKLQEGDRRNQQATSSSAQEQALPWYQTIKSRFPAGNTTGKKEEGFVLLSKENYFPVFPGKQQEKRQLHTVT